MTDPPQECPTRITSPSARSIALLVAVTSSARDVVGFCTEITLYPLSTSGLMTLPQEEPSAQSPWTKTIVGLVFVEPPVCANAVEPRNNPPTNIRMPTFFIHASYCAGEGCKWESPLRISSKNVSCTDTFEWQAKPHSAPFGSSLEGIRVSVAAS